MCLSTLFYGTVNQFIHTFHRVICALEILIHQYKRFSIQSFSISNDIKLL